MDASVARHPTQDLLFTNRHRGMVRARLHRPFEWNPGRGRRLDQISRLVPQLIDSHGVRPPDRILRSGVRLGVTNRAGPPEVVKVT